MRDLTYNLLLAAVSLLLVASLPTTHAQSSATYKLADGFDYPVGKPSGSGYYKARGYWPNGHLGEDWNGKGGGNTDEGDPIYSIANGVVVYSDDFKQGWGNVIIIRHAYRERSGRIHYIDSLYGHLKVRMLRLGEEVKRGQQVGTMGRGPRGMYYAHLHFEIRKNLAIGMNRSKYTGGYENYHKPTHFIDNNRKLRKEFRRVSIPMNTFLKSNPNQFTSKEVEMPTSPTYTVIASRPSVPEEVRKVMETEHPKGAPVPEKVKTFWDRFKSRIRK